MDVVVNVNSPVYFNNQNPKVGQPNEYLNLFHCLGYAKNYPPIADWLRQYHGLRGEWWVVSPVYWQATHNDALLLACSHLFEGHEADARALFDDFSHLVAADGMQTHYHDADRWLLQCDGKPSITASPPHALLNQSMFPHLKLLDDTFFWQRLMTEVQMLFLGKKANGIWIWGGGRLEAPSKRQILVNHQQHHAMARLLSYRVNDYGDARIDENAICWFDSLSPSELSILQTALQHHHVNWYWNNGAYSTQKPSWFSRFFSFK